MLAGFLADKTHLAAAARTTEGVLFRRIACPNAFHAMLLPKAGARSRLSVTGALGGAVAGDNRTVHEISKRGHTPLSRFMGP